MMRRPRDTVAIRAVSDSLKAWRAHSPHYEDLCSNTICCRRLLSARSGFIRRPEHRSRDPHGASCRHGFKSMLLRRKFSPVDCCYVRSRLPSLNKRARPAVAPPDVRARTITGEHRWDDSPDRVVGQEGRMVRKSGADPEAFAGPDASAGL